MPPVPVVTQDGSEIRARRVRLGFTLTRLGKQIGRHPQALGHIERETRNASEVLLNQIANALGAEPGDLIKQREPAA